MKAYDHRDVPAQPVEGRPGVSIRWVIGKNVEAPTFSTRIIELAPGAATEHHTHPWEHEVYVLEGQGTVTGEEGQAALAPGMCVYVAPGELHQFANAGASTLRFICIIPNAPST